MDDIQKNPMKIYVQDIYRASRTDHNRYVFEMFGQRFKNIMIHGIVTTLNTCKKDAAHFELSDPTGTVQIYYDSTTNNQHVSKKTMRDLIGSFASISRYHDENVLTMSSLLNSIEKKHLKPLDFEEGSYISVVGDIFTDQTGVRCISAYTCKSTSVDRDILWMEELHYLYKKYYLNPVDSG
ncbi:uncharacterized protein LOC121738045 [Aricia agestis]|uniref:uncharacterized protein LOC121738045 n=1 Tax=Aricia agestis TaxID=91739 RepID=UPI001C202A89|nr:uncharacterized protein LOC121738045 [Aricia agestis]